MYCMYEQSVCVYCFICFTIDICTVRTVNSIFIHSTMCMYIYAGRDANEKNLLLEQNCAQSLGQDNVKFLFDSEDILETGLSIQNLNVKSGYFDRYLGMMKLNLNAMDLDEVFRYCNV